MINSIAHESKVNRYALLYMDRTLDNQLDIADIINDEYSMMMMMMISLPVRYLRWPDM